MNKSEQEIYEEIIKLVEDNNRLYDYTLNIYKWDEEKFKKSCMYTTKKTYLDYLDWRKNLIQIDNFCKYTGEKINKKRIKEYLFNYFELWNTYVKK